MSNHQSPELPDLDRLPPCPFCGVHLEIERDDGNNFYDHPNGNCILSGTEIEEDRLHAWIRRAQPEGEAPAPVDSVALNLEAQLRAVVRERDELRAQQAAAPGSLPDLLPPLGIRNDRDMLNYLMTAFDNEIANCERCGHAEPTKNMDSASFLRDYLAASSSAPGTPEAPKQLAHGHREDFYLLANARRIGMMPIRQVINMTNWHLAHELFATGSNSSHQICVDAGINPAGYEVQRAAQLNGGQGEGDGHADQA